MTIYSAAMLLFLVMDPMGNIPLFLTELKDINARRRRIIILRELLIALFILTVFLFAGKYVLQVLQITEPSLTIAGGIILFLIALKMIFPIPGRIENGNTVDGEPFLVPLAIPLVAGPSSLTTVMLIMSQDSSRWPEWLIALVAAWFASGVILLVSDRLSRLIGKRVLIAMERLMGMILTTIAIQMIMTGIRNAWGG